MPIDVGQIINRLHANAQAVEALLQQLPSAQAAWQPSPRDWSILQVVGHLLDEETLDFRLRLTLLLQDPALPWPVLDPEQTVLRHAHQQGSLPVLLAQFLSERRASLVWLAALAPTTDWWGSSYQHPAGALRAGDLLHSWVAHDCLHLRQLAELCWQYQATRAAPFSVTYAGDF